VREYWIVEPNLSVILPYVLENNVFIGKAPMMRGDKVSPAIFPELILDLEDIFKE
jgi:Uma2 family endonuclease